MIFSQLSLQSNPSDFRRTYSLYKAIPPFLVSKVQVLNQLSLQCMNLKIENTHLEISLPKDICLTSKKKKN